MSLLWLALIAVAVANPPGVFLAAPHSPVTWPARALSAVVVGAVAVTLAAASGPLLDALSLSPESFWWGAGAVLIIAGARWMIVGPPEPFPLSPGWPSWAAGLVPLGFPLQLTPAVAVWAVAAGTEEGLRAGIVLGAAVVLTAALVGAGQAGRAGDMGAGLLGGLARVAGGGMAVAGGELVYRGVSTL